MTWPRRIVPGTTYLLTRRCTQRRFMLVPRGIVPMDAPDPQGVTTTLCRDLECAERKEPSLDAAVQETMKVITRAVLVIALGLSGCASAPTPVRPRVQAWPASVDETCPERTVALECFRGWAFPRKAIGAGMETLVERFRACHRPGAEPVKVTLRIETHGSSAACVDRSPQDNETARCVATVAARHLVIPGSTPDETCGFRYPVWFE